MGGWVSWRGREFHFTLVILHNLQLAQFFVSPAPLGLSALFLENPTKTKKSFTLKVFIEYSIHTQDGAVTTATGGWLCDGTSSTDWTSGLWSLFFGDASYEWSVNVVEKFGGISVPSWGDFRDFKSPQGKNFHRRDGTARRPIPEVAPGSVGRSWDKGIFPRTPGRQTRGSRSGIPVPIRSEQRSSYAGNLRGTRSSGRSSGGELRRVATQHRFYWFGLYDKH